MLKKTGARDDENSQEDAEERAELDQRFARHLDEDLLGPLTRWCVEHCDGLLLGSSLLSFFRGGGCSKDELVPGVEQTVICSCLSQFPQMQDRQAAIDQIRDRVRIHIMDVTRDW